MADWQGLERPLRGASSLSTAAAEDLRCFSRMLIEQYVAVPSEECRRVDAQHMNLGMRWAFVHDPDVMVGFQHYDVFSLNRYGPHPAEEIAKVAALTSKPVLVGEFHFGALDRGLTSTGIRGVTSQAERGVAFRYYAEKAAALPNSVGVHYFILNDQPMLGRHDGENYQIGVVDVCHRPYPEFERGIRETSRTIYQVVQRRCTDAPPPVEIPRIG
jgi:hypothetical protein